LDVSPRDYLFPSGTIVLVHNLRNRLFLPDHGLTDMPLMVSVSDIIRRPYLRRSIGERGIKAHLGVEGPIMLDSGGFSISGITAPVIDIDELISLYSGIDADVLAALDVPPSLNDSPAVRAVKWRRSLRYLDRLAVSLADSRIMPVVHGRDLSEIARACHDVRLRVSRPKTVALGGMVPFLRGAMSRERIGPRRSRGAQRPGVEFVADALALCRSHFPESRIHVFGVGSPTTAIALIALGADSVDSLAWRRAAGYGTIFLPGCAERIVSVKARQRFSRPVLSVRDRRALQRCCCPVCQRHPELKGRIGALGTSYVARAVHNVWTLMSEQDALRSARTTGELGRFLASRVHGRHRFVRAIQVYLASAEDIEPVSPTTGPAPPLLRELAIS
jgi:queuine/archaeosine tRNA-ribosyltransferase